MVENYHDQPLVVIKVFLHIGILKLIMAVSADDDYILRVVPFGGVKMMHFKAGGSILLEKPEITHLTMPLIDS